MAPQLPEKEMKASSSQRKVPLAFFFHISLFCILTVPPRFMLPHLLREVIIWGPALSLCLPREARTPYKVLFAIHVK